jgi:hypothetical protein
MKSLRTCNGVALPLHVSALAAGVGMQPPFSLRDLMNRTGSRTKVVRVALLRYAWATPKPSPTAPPRQWDDSQVSEIFFLENGWSSSQYWWRCSMGLLELVLVDLPPWRTLPGKQTDLDKARGDVNAYIRTQAAADGVVLTKYDQIITIVDPPPGDRGAVSAPGDVVVDEGVTAPYSNEFFQHEIGHLLGFKHTFGPAGDGTWRAYNDNFDVMGDTGPNARPISPVPAGLSSLPLYTGVNFWQSGRRLSAASLYRYIPAFAASSSVVRPTLPSTVRLVALTRARFGDPVVAVIPTNSGEVTVEYRIAQEDDIGISIAPLLLMHTIGRRTLPPNASEVNPIVFEGTSSSGPGATISTPEGDVSASVVGGGNSAPSVTLSIT